jgi:hypothetical protein
MSHRIAASLAAALVLAAGSAGAQDLRPAQGGSISLGPLNGIVYYTEAQEGYRVVATLSDGRNTTSPIRLVATLQPGQEMTLSVPHMPGVPADEVHLRRQGDHLVVSDPIPMTE